MRRLSISVLAWFLAAGIAAADEFCVVANGGRVCGYFNYSSCLDAASRQNGACIVQTSPAPNFQSAPYPPPPPRLSPPNPGAYDWGRSIMDGYEAGVRDRQAREARSVPAPAPLRAHPVPTPEPSLGPILAAVLQTPEQRRRAACRLYVRDAFGARTAGDESGYFALMDRYDQCIANEIEPPTQ